MRDAFITSSNLAEAVGLSNEQVRRLRSGDSLPSPKSLRRICEVLKAPVRQLAKIAALDVINRIGCDEGWRRLGVDPRYAEIYVLWERLTEPQQNHVLWMARWLKRKNVSK
jgi:transcriptional regulator with XRE-family HTH domain